MLNQKDLREQFHVNHLSANEYSIYNRRTERFTIPCLHTANHKYGKDMSYCNIAYYDTEEKKSKTTTYQRFLYTYFIGDIPKGYDVDHIDGESMHNWISNLQLLTRKENLAKRKGEVNQWAYKKGNK